MPDAKPAPAPHMGLIHAFGICVDCICIREIMESLGPVGGIVLRFVEVDGLSLGVSYWDDRIAGVCSGSRSKDMS